MTDSVFWRYAIFSQKAVPESLNLWIQRQEELDWKYMVLAGMWYDFSKILKVKEKLMNSKVNGFYERYLRLWDHLFLNSVINSAINSSFFTKHLWHLHVKVL